MAALISTYAVADRPLKARPGVGETIGQTLTMARRAYIKMMRNPEQFFDVTIQPLLFTAMFAYIFGGAIRAIGSALNRSKTPVSMSSRSWVPRAIEAVSAVWARMPGMRIGR